MCYTLKNMMKFSSLTVFLFFIKASLMAAPLSMSLKAESAILINADTGAILYEKKPHAKLFPASITKIPIAALALKIKGDDLGEMIAAEQDCIGSVTEEAKQRSNYSLPSHWLVTDSCHMGIKRGEVLSLKDLIYGMMIVSADDASNVIAHTLGNGSIPAFMEQVNHYIQSLGCKNTYFNNPHGLHHPKHVTTAYDMALITQDAMKIPRFKEIVATTRFTRPKTNKQESTILLQTNRLLRKGEYYYPRAIGVKTGQTSKAGKTLVAAATENGRTLIAVLLNAKDRKDSFNEAIRLFDAAFSQVEIEKVFIKAGPQRHSLAINGAKQSVNTYTQEDVALTYFPSEEPKVKAFLQWDQVDFPISKDQKVGQLHLKNEQDQILKSVSLFAENDVDGMLSFKIRSWLAGSGSKILLICSIVALVLCGIYAILRFSRR